MVRLAPLSAATLLLSIMLQGSARPCCALADHAAAAHAHNVNGAPQCEGHAHDMMFPMLLQQDKDILPPLPTNLLIVFLTLSFVIPLIKYIFRLLKAQFDLFMAAANQDQDDEEGLIE
jgi:hypothetical protein